MKAARETLEISMEELQELLEKVRPDITGRGFSEVKGSGVHLGVRIGVAGG
jgi:hypothetical protein